MTNRIRIEDSSKRIRVYLGGELVADTSRPRLVWEKPYYPVYYFPRADVRGELLMPTEETKRSPSRGTAQIYDVKGGGRIAEGAAYAYEESPLEDLVGYVAFRWDAMDAWFEEDEEVFVHARDPYTRVDILASSRHVRVEINGVTVADTHKPSLLFETGLPTRYYIPLVDVRMDLLSPSDTATSCPYKGTASYYHVEANGETFEDYAWYYKFPVEESSRIAGLVSFYNEKVDIYVDGELAERPQTVFS